MSVKKGFVIMAMGLWALVTSVQASLFVDDFKRPNTSAGYAKVLENGWIDGVGKYNENGGQWSLYDGECIGKNGDSKWNPAEHYILNKNAETMPGGFSLDFDFRVLSPSKESVNGGLFEVGDRDGKEGDDGYIVSFNTVEFFFERLENGERISLEKYAYIDNAKLEAKTDYHFSVASIDADSWLFELSGPKGEKLASQELKRFDSKNWENSKNLLGGMMHGPEENEGTMTSFDNFRVESTEAVPEPAIISLVLVFGGVLIAVHRFPRGAKV